MWWVEAEVAFAGYFHKVFALYPQVFAHVKAALAALGLVRVDGRVAGIERAQMLLESPSRAALQRVLAACQPLLHQLRASPAHRAVVRWAVDVDPLAL